MLYLFGGNYLCDTFIAFFLSQSQIITDSGEGLAQLNVKKEKFERCVKMINDYSCWLWRLVGFTARLASIVRIPLQ